MDIDQYVILLQANTADLIFEIDGVDLSLRRAEESWGIYEILEHIYLIDRAVCSILSKQTNEYAQTNELFGFEKMKKYVSSENQNKYHSPDFGVPKGPFELRNTWIEKIIALRNDLENQLKAGEINIDNRMFKHPFLGLMPISDWLYSIVFHSERHIHQIKEIKSKTGN